MVVCVVSCEKRVEKLNMPVITKKEDDDSELEMERFQETPLSGDTPMAENLNDTSEYPNRDSKSDPNNEDRGSPVEDLTFPKMTNKRPIQNSYDDRHKVDIFNRERADDSDIDERPREVAFLGARFGRRHSIHASMLQSSQNPYKPVSHYLHPNLDNQPSNHFQMTPIRRSKRNQRNTGQQHHQTHSAAIGSAHTLDELYQCWNDAVDEGKLDEIFRHEIDVGSCWDVKFL